MLQALYAGVLLLNSASICVDALPWDGAARTTSIENDLGWTPKPTQAPIVKNELAPAPMGLGPLHERQLGFSTCGWVDKLYQYSFTCFATNVCVTNRKNNAQGCLPYRHSQYENLFIPTACVASTALSAICDLGCAEDPFTLHCISDKYPECYTAYFDYNTKTLSYVGCTPKKIPNFTVYMSYTNRRTTNSAYSVSATNYITGWTGSPYLFYTPPSLSRKLSDSKTSSETTDTDTAPIPVSTSRSPNEGGGNTPNGNSGGDDSGGGGTPVGAIVGGVIGGIALICICVAVTVFLCLRHRKKTAAAPQGQSGPANDGSYGGPPMGYVQTPQQGSYQQPMSPPHYGPGTNTHLGSNIQSPSERPSSGVAPSPTTYGTTTVSTSPNNQHANLVDPNNTAVTYAQEKSPLVEADDGNAVGNTTHPAHRAVEADSTHIMTNPDGRPVHEVPG